MSQAEDELMHMTELKNEDSDNAARAAILLIQERKKAKDKLQVYEALVRYPPYTMLMQELQSDMESAFLDMEKVEDPIGLAKATAAYVTLRRVVTHVPKHIESLVTFLKEEGTL